MFWAITPNGTRWKFDQARGPNPLPNVPQMRETIPEMEELNPAYNYKEINAGRKYDWNENLQQRTIKTIEELKREGTYEELVERDGPKWWELYNRVQNKITKMWHYVLKT